MTTIDIQRWVSVYPDRDGRIWWTKAWFNGRKKGEHAIEITRAMAIKFIKDQIEKDAWLKNTFLNRWKSFIRRYSKQENK